MRNNIVVGQGYTIPLCDIIQQIYADDHPDELIDTEEVPTWKEGLEQIATEIEYARTQIFYFDYPCYGDSDDKKELETHILEAYYTRDICCDSVMRWVMYLKDRLHDIMPKYVALYNAQMELIASDILDPYHLRETKDVTSDKTILKTNDSTTKNTSHSDNVTDAQSISTTDGIDNTSSKDVNKFSNTPQAMASAIDSGSDIQLSYLSNMSVNESNTDNEYNSVNTGSDVSKTESKRDDDSQYQSTDTGTENKIDRVVRDIKGNLSKMNNAELIKDYQDAILNIEKMITDDLRDLFYLMY